MDLEFECPHCKEILIVNTTEINCGIFRHGVFIETGEQINPHETKVNCDKFVEENKIYGCGKPFEIIKVNDKYNISICDYK
jgi:hypothetical protein